MKTYVYAFLSVVRSRMHRPLFCACAVMNICMCAGLNYSKKHIQEATSSQICLEAQWKLTTDIFPRHTS